MLFSSLVLGLASVLQSTGAAALNSTDPLIVQTNVGAFQGFYSSSTVRNWLGIRYGRATNGTRRFRPPQRSEILSLDSPFNASAFSPTCPNVGIAAGYNTTYDEDCLSLNIWSPAQDRLNSSSTGATVMIWIYGGGFVEGGSAVPMYNGNNFVRDQEDLIIVSINYRVSIYGFPAGSGAGPYDLNPGLQDQRMAVEWVYNNIRNFGGDPSKITLFGESAGASSIGAYAYAYQEDPIARGLIMESGSEFLNQPISVPQGNAASAVGWSAVAAAIGCNSSTQAVAFACMQDANVTALSNAVNNYTSASTAFLPTMDGVLLLSADNYTELSTAAAGGSGGGGGFARIPVLIGTNNNEGTVLVGPYGGGNAALATGITNVEFTCPAAKVSGARQNATVPSWQYRYFGTWPGITPINSTLGTYHSAEISIVFGTYANDSSTTTVSRAQVETSRTMQSAWAAFAKDPTDGLVAFGWPRYEANGTSLVQVALNYYNVSQAVLDASADPVISFNNSQAYNGVC